jgi:hypothetical protein
MNRTQVSKADPPTAAFVLWVIFQMSSTVNRCAGLLGSGGDHSIEQLPIEMPAIAVGVKREIMFVQLWLAPG